MKTRKWTLGEVESLEVRNWSGLKIAINLSVEMLIIRKASSDTKMDLKFDKLKNGKYYFLKKNIPHGMPEIGVEQGDGFCHIELLFSQHHSQKEDIAHTEGTQTLMKGNLNSKSVILLATKSS